MLVVVTFTMYWCATPKEQHLDSHFCSCVASGLDEECESGLKSAISTIHHQR